MHTPLSREHDPNTAFGGLGAVVAGRAASGSARLLQWMGMVGSCLVAASAFWVFDALPFQDLPAHAGLIALRDRLTASPFEQQFYIHAPQLGPYSLFRALGSGLSRFLGPVGAVRVLATLPVVATPAALLFARRRLYGDRSLSAGYFGVALSLGFMTLLGFASYLLGIAALVLVLTLWLDLLARVDRQEPSRRLELVLLVAAVGLFVAHGHAFVIFLGMAFVTCMVARNRLSRLVRLRALVPAVAVAAWSAYLTRPVALVEGSAPLASPPFELRFQALGDKLSLLVTPTLITRTGIDIAVGLVLWAVLAASTVDAVRAVRKSPPGRVIDDSLTHSRDLLACTVVAALAFVALPHSIGWFGFVDGRLVPIVMLLAVLAAREPRGRLATWFELAPRLSAWAMGILVLVASSRFQEEARGFHEVLDAVPAEARLLNLPLRPESALFTAHPFVHYDKLVLADRPVVVSDIWFHQGTAIYPTPRHPALRLPSSYSESDLRSIDWPSYDLSDWDYVLIRTRPDDDAPDVPAALALAQHRAGWWLYRTASSASANP